MLLRDLGHMRGQVLAVALVVACGVATYVTMRSSYESLVASQSTYYTRYRFAEVFTQVKRAPEALVAEIAAIRGVAAVQTRVVHEVTLDVAGLDEPATGRLVSIPERRRPMLNDLFIRRGRYVEPGQRGEVLISEAFSEANKLDVGDQIIAVINGRRESLRIVGVALSPEYVNEIRGPETFPDNRRFGVLWMSREALGPAFDMEGAFNDLSLSLVPGVNPAIVIDRLDVILERYGGLGAHDRRDQLSHRFLSDEIEQDRITGIIIPSIFLGIAAFLIHIVLSRLVSTQRSQIAVLKAFGYGSVTVGVHYLKFALAAVLAGTASGAALGIWWGSALADLYKQFFRFPELEFHLAPDTVGLAVLISGGSAILGAMSAVRRVAALPPAEAMRPEAPPRFKPGVFERAGLQRMLSPAARMILRNIERRPLRAALSVLGIALAVSILVVGRYFFDALDYIIEVQFRTIQREDVAVTFNNPRASGAKYDLANLPGVLSSEPFRAVPARLRFEHRSRRTGLLGLSPASELRRPMGRDLQPVDLPPDGLVLGVKLAQVLGASAGDVVTVEVLEGARPVARIPVVRLVDDLVGLSAYMDARALNRLMREGGTISGGYLCVDSLSSAHLYSLLKSTPAVAGVAIREAMLESFMETVAESLLISTTFLIGFACIIALGMVYSGARIALSERGNELASLRVLGFTRREVALLLLGEQALLTAAAMPIGFLLGFGICVLTAGLMNTELYRIPVVVSNNTYGFAFLVVATAAVLSGLLVLRRLYGLDLIAVLKSRE